VVKKFFHAFWRILILSIGLIIIWAAVFELFPYADARLPAYAAGLLIYCLLAYIAIPAVIRLFRLVIKSNHIPLYATTGDGWPSDPVNLAIIVKDRQKLIEIMEKAGWYMADKATFKNMSRELASIIFNLPYRRAPFMNLYLFNRPHDIGFEIPTGPTSSARTRHHIRFWRLEAPLTTQKNTTHYIFWVKQFRHLFHLDKEIWIGAAIEESHPIDIQWRTGQLNHGGNRHSDRERDFIIQTLRNIKSVKGVHQTKTGEKIKFRGQQFNIFYYTDGGIKAVELK
jgi:hypothetical protein